jgi:hypothetical protein
MTEHPFIPIERVGAILLITGLIYSLLAAATSFYYSRLK